MKTIYIKSLLLLVLGLVLTPVVAYEPPTHGLLSEAAFLASDLEQDNDLYQDLGISKEDIFLRSDGEYKEIVEILKFGSAKEDSVIPAPRPPNHFFNPLNDEGLIDFIYYPTTPIFVDFFPSPSWILEDDGQIENFLFLFDQDYSYADAVSYFYDALTLADGEERKDKFGKLFETLGHVIHHVQDMAQPEHVRDDPHLTFFDNSAYEKYVLDKTADELINSQLPVSGYPVPDVGTFGKARDFWIHDQEGLAEFTNYNFVSVDTNFRGDLNNIIPDPDFPNPNGINAVVNQVSGAELGIPTFAENAGWFIETPVVDSLNPDQSIPNIHTSFYSLYDSDLEVMGFDKIFSLNTFTFQSAMEFLIPRAVSYSAGLINHFFRGRLEKT